MKRTSDNVRTGSVNCRIFAFVAEVRNPERGRGAGLATVCRTNTRTCPATDRVAHQFSSREVGPFRTFGVPGRAVLGDVVISSESDGVILQIVISRTFSSSRHRPPSSIWLSLQATHQSRGLRP